MSTIRVDNFGPSAGGTTYSAQGIAKARANFNGTGTAAIRASENISSLTDHGTGNYTLTVTSAFTGSDYSPVSMGNEGYNLDVYHTSAAPTASALRVLCWHNGFYDPQQANVAFLGDLA